MGNKSLSDSVEKAIYSILHLKLNDTRIEKFESKELKSLPLARAPLDEREANQLTSRRMACRKRLTASSAAV